MNNTLTVIRNKPVAQQVEDILRERIHQGIYPPNQRIPSEERLADELQVSRASLRTAMASLAAEGYIQRRHGDGTYVRPRAVAMTLRQVRTWDIERQIQESGRKPSLRILEQTQRPARPLEAEKLGLRVGDDVLGIQRLFCADEKPVVLIANTIKVTDLKIPLSPEAASLSPVEFLEQILQPQPRDGQVHFSAILADANLADLFKVGIGQPLLFMDSLVFDSSGRPIIYETETYLGHVGFRMQLEFS